MFFISNLRFFGSRKLQKIFVLTVGFLLLITAIYRLSHDDFPLKYSTEHFTFYYTKADSATIGQVEKQLEDHYGRIINELKPKTMPNIRVFLYPDIKSFNKYLADEYNENPHYIGVQSLKDEFRMISPNLAQELDVTYDYMMQAVVHEFTHCVIANMVDYVSPSWLWLNESVASYEAGTFYHPNEYEYKVNGKYPTIFDLKNNDFDERKYVVGYAIIQYIRDTWGMESVRLLILNQGDIPATFQISEMEFEEGWHKYLDTKYF